MFGRKKFKDEEIIDEIRGGNQEALTYLYQNNFSSVRNYIIKNNGTIEDVDDVLQDAGRISHDVAKRLAEEQYEKFAEQRRLDGAKEVSDFDAFLAKSKQIPKSR